MELPGIHVFFEQLSVLMRNPSNKKTASSFSDNEASPAEDENDNTPHRKKKQRFYQNRMEKLRMWSC